MRKRSVLRLLILGSLYYLIANCAHPVEPTFYQLLALPDYMFGVAFAAMATTVFLFSPFWGKMADLHGPNRILWISFICYGIGQLYFFFLADSIIDILLARLFSGIFIGGIGVGQLVYIMENSNPEDKARALTVFATVGAICSAFGYLVGGVLGNASLRLCLSFHVGGLWFLSLLHFLILEDTEREAHKQNIKDLLKDANPLKAFHLPEEAVNLAFLSFLSVCVLTSFATNCYDQCFNYFIKDQYGFPPSYNGYLKGAVGIITLIANSTICSYLLYKTDIRKSIIFIFGICLLMMTGIILIDEVVPFIVLNVIFFGFNAVYKPLLQSMLNSFSRKASGSIVGIYNSLSSVGTITGSLVAGFVYEKAPKGSFVYTAVAFVLAILCSMIQQHSMKEL